jgi:hypothetical protein
MPKHCGWRVDCAIYAGWPGHDLSTARGALNPGDEPRFSEAKAGGAAIIPLTPDGFSHLKKWAGFTVGETRRDSFRSKPIDRVGALDCVGCRHAD